MRVPLLLLLLALTAPARAQELGVTAEVERPIARTGGEDPSASTTEVDARDRPRALDTLEDALREAPGARPLSSGAYGSPTTLSLRGSDGEQVEVVFGDVPITTADGSAFDLSTVPLWALERIEVTRGGGPTWLGVSGIGGVLRLVPREARGTRVEAAAGAGSFGLGHGRSSASVEGEGLRWLASAGGTSSEGDFTVLDDQRTALDPSDDRERPRQNAYLREGAGLAHLSAPLLGGRLTAFGFGLGRTGGVPGPASQETRRTRRHEVHLLGALGWERTEGARPADEADWRVGASLAVGFRRRRFADPLGEIGLALPRVTEDDALRTVLRVAGSGRALPWLELTGVGLFTHEQLWPDDALALAPPRGSARDGGTFGVEARFFGRVEGVRVEVRPSARLAVVGSRLHELRRARLGEARDALAVAPTARLGAALELLPGLTVAASAASATRLPSMVELFGDRGFLLGDTALRPERAETVDLGLAIRGRAGPLTGQAELRGFATFATDLIRYTRTSVFQAVPQNVASAILGGAELGVRGTITRHVAVSGALTLLETEGETPGRRLPLRPWLTAYVRPELRVFALGPLDTLSLFADVTHVSESFADPANTTRIPARTRLGVGVSFSTWERRLRIDASVRDALDARGTDLLGFPLPGRALAVSLRLKSD